MVMDIVSSSLFLNKYKTPPKIVSEITFFFEFDGVCQISRFQPYHFVPVCDIHTDLRKLFIKKYFYVRSNMVIDFLIDSIYLR